jgi:hypothetical protein
VPRVRCAGSGDTAAPVPRAPAAVPLESENLT